MAARTANGTCVDVHTVSRPSGASGCATMPRGSIGIAATRGTLSFASTIACASAKPRVTSPTDPVDGPATLSGHSSKTRAAPGASAASTVAADFSTSYRTSTASAASAAAYTSSATTTATASPAWRTFGPPIAGWA